MAFHKYMAVHEAAHAVVAVHLGGFAEGIFLDRRGAAKAGCLVSWPDDGDERTDERLLTLAAGPAATAVYTRSGQSEAIWRTGIGDWRTMKELGDTGDAWFTKARQLCRELWPQIIAVAEAARVAGRLDEDEILLAMQGVRA